MSELLEQIRQLHENAEVKISVAVLITAHRPDLSRWHEDFVRRIETK
jgi:hypothetical protein